MKKKIILALLAIVCAFCCVFGLAACTNNNKEFVGLVAASSDDLSEKTNYIELGQYSYGEDAKINADLSLLKFYKYYSDGTTGEEVSVSELDAIYDYGGDSSSNKPKPDKYYARSGNTERYSITYSMTGVKNPVQVVFEVEPATSGNFSISLSKTQWKYGEDLPTVTLNNPAGLPVQHIEDAVDGIVTKDDTNGAYDVCYVEKDIYDTFTAQQKTDLNYFLTGGDGEFECKRFDRTTPADGEYMLFGMIYNTHNYMQIVTPAVKFTVQNAIIERTFTFNSIIVQDSSGNPVNDTENEFVYMALSMNTANQGTTVICKTNGEVRGTVDFGGGEFDSLSDQEVYKYEKTDENKIALKQGSSVVGEGVLIDNLFTLKMPIDEDYCFIITFIGQ